LDPDDDSSRATELGCGRAADRAFFQRRPPQPTLFSETLVGGGADAPHYAWFAEVIWTLLPQMVQSGVATAETVAIETLESRLRSAVVEARSQVEGPAQICAWTRI
jgi:hypothetical protein